MNFEITAIRYQMPGKDFEEKTKNAPNGPKRPKWT